MLDLSFEDVDMVSGGRRQYDWVPDAESEWGKTLNDATNMLGNWGAALGGWIYDETH